MNTHVLEQKKTVVYRDDSPPDVIMSNPIVREIHNEIGQKYIKHNIKKKNISICSIKNRFAYQIKKNS